jgi:hypothetical protein
MTDTHTALCGACRRRLTVEAGDVCTQCRTTVAEQLADLPHLARRLVLAMVPGGRHTNTGRVSSSGKSPPLPARLNPLSLISAGALRAPEHVERQVRTWTEVVTVFVDGQRHDVPVRHRELAYGPNGAPVFVAAGDQADPLPIPTWLDLWEALVRRHFHDQDPPMPAPYRANVDRRAYTRAALYADRPPVRALSEPATAAHDPLETEWLTRFGVVAGWDRADNAADYLRRRLGDVCDLMDLDAVELVIELRALYGAARAAAGETSDLVYLGRCPERIVNRESGYEEPCGAHLVQDPFATVVRCPRCRTETGVRKWMWLARRIRDTWHITSEGAAA